MEAETLGATLGYVEPEAPVDTLADIWRGVKPETLSEKLADVKAGILHEREWVM